MAFQASIPLLLLAASVNAADLIRLKIKELGAEGTYHKQRFSRRRLEWICLRIECSGTIPQEKAIN
jgi:hypothetical protein